MWRIEDPDNAQFYVQSTDDAWEADPQTRAQIKYALENGWTVPATPVGPTYLPTGTDDVYGVYLLALALLGGEVEGEPPPTGTDLFTPDPKLDVVN